MFIQTEDTPNPNVLKFLPGKKISAEPYDIPNNDVAVTLSSLAVNLLHIKGVESLFFGYDFISVTKDDTLEWLAIKAPILGVMMEYFISEQPILDLQDSSDKASNDSQDIIYDEADQEAVTQIKELLETRVRPAVARDGGDIIFHGFDKGVVYLKMQGACAGCPSSSATLKMGVENLLKHFVPDVIEVREVVM